MQFYKFILRKYSDVYWKLPIKFIGIGSSIGKNWKYWNMQIFQYLMYIGSFQSNFLDIGHNNWKLLMKASNTSNTKISNFINFIYIVNIYLIIFIFIFIISNEKT